MVRHPISDMSAWPSLNLEGNLIAPAMIARIDQRDAPEQTPEDYTVRKGLTIREEISTAFRVGQSHFDAFAKLDAPSQDATRRFVSGFFKETFGFHDLAPTAAPLAMIASGRVPVVVVPPSETLDRRSPTLSVDRSRSPAFALQDYLNDNEDALWGIVTNGFHLRLMRDNASLTRPAYIEADLAQIFSTEDIASFAALWLLIHRTRFGAQDTPATDCALERWRETGSREGEAARDRLAGQVQLALKLLGSGFLEANPDLAAKLKSGEINLTEWFNELLRLVYRLIFLMVAEDRNLLHPVKSKVEARTLYAEGYSLAGLRKQCTRAATWDKHHDRYEGIKIVFRALAHGQEALALPALGGLFAEDKLPHLETARLRNRAFMEALYRLSWLAGKSSMVPVNWRAMETEELGSVYETLLELQPQLGDDGKTLIFASETAEQKGNQRKTTGSYYTPDSLVQALLDTALDPVLDKTEAKADDPAKALLKLSVIDPACGSGHFLLAAARRIATRLARIRAEGTPSLADFRHALRDVARRCIHGVDRNPMAVELTKVALWIETVDPGLPLGFFDAQIRCGDALLGVFDLKVLQDGIPDAAYKPLTGDDKETAKYYRDKNKREKKERDRIAEGFGFYRQQDLMRDYAKLRAMPEETLNQIEAKANRLQELSAEGASAWQLETACDLYIAAFLLPKKAGGQFAGPDGLPRRGAESVPTSGALWEWLRGVQPFGPMFGTSIEAARETRAFHWPLEFPDVMQRGGFDVVLGNPPWDKIQAEEQSFFASRDPVISAATGQKRKRMIEGLRATNPKIHSEFEEYKRNIGALDVFAKNSGRYGLTGKGKLNTYALFSELNSNLLTPLGRCGIIVPIGLVTDDTTKEFFGGMLKANRLVSVLGFENEEFIFPSVHHAFRFINLTISGSELTQPTVYSFFNRNVRDIQNPERIYGLTSNEVIAINPNTENAPIFRSKTDAELNLRIYRDVPVFINDQLGQNSWEANIRRMFNPTDDSDLFSEDPSRFKDPIPLYEAKMIHQFDHRFGSYLGQTEAQRRQGKLPETTPDEHADPNFRIQHKNWMEKNVAEAAISSQTDSEWYISFRDITNASSYKTVICCILPRVPTVDPCRNIFLGERTGALDASCLLACLNSIVFDYLARQKVSGNHLAIFIFKQIPVLPPERLSVAQTQFVAARVLELTYTDYLMAPFARDLGHDGPPFVWDEDRRALLRADLDAFYARAYGLTRDELRYILDPADVKGSDYPSETFRVLKEKEIRQHGEYRTRRLVLEAWDRMEQDGEFEAMGI